MFEAGVDHLSTREKKDIMPENNEGMYAVPQILTKNAEDFIQTAETLQEYGYNEVNLNLGCPSKTVVTKGRGKYITSYGLYGSRCGTDRESSRDRTGKAIGFLLEADFDRIDDACRISWW